MAKSMYIHVPFCDSICAYCDFERCKKHPILTQKWLNVMISDIKKKENERIETLYIGGGTPTSLSESQLDELLSACDVFHPQEFTIEANIENLSREKIQILTEHKVNRISLGVQSLQERLISLIERHHSAEDVMNKIDEIYDAGITNISVDLIYGLPTQTLDEWLLDLNQITSNPKVSHLSIYSLTIEENSTFGRKNISKISDEEDEEMYFQALKVLKEQGFYHYEISNFARENKESRHNQAYWNYDDFIGIGCGAYGMENHVYYHYPFRLNEYLNQTLECEKTFLSVEDEKFESIMMGLRQKKGIDLVRWNHRFKGNFIQEYGDILQHYTSVGYLIYEKNHVFCSEAGMAVLNTILLDFMKET